VNKFSSCLLQQSLEVEAGGTEEREMVQKQEAGAQALARGPSTKHPAHNPTSDGIPHVLVCMLGLYLFFIFFIVVLGGDTLGHLQKFLQCIMCEFTLSMALLYLPSPIPGVVSTGIIFCICIHVYTVYAPYSPFYPLSPPPLPSHWYQPSPGGRTRSTLLFSVCRRKKEKNDILAYLRKR
jgi:hypothetical protein